TKVAPGRSVTPHLRTETGRFPWSGIRPVSQSGSASAVRRAVDRAGAVGDVHVVVVVGVARPEDLGETGAAGGVVERALRVRVRSDAEIGRVAPHVPAGGRTTHRRVAGDAADAGRHADRLVTELVAHRLELPHDALGVLLGGGGRDLAAVEVVGAAVGVELRVGEVDRGAVAALQFVDLAERLRAGDAVGRQSVAGLEPLHRGRGGRTVLTVDGQVLAGADPACDTDLELGDRAAARSAAERVAPGVTAVRRCGRRG